ncbi:hypothetical protein, partial [Pseudomonas sp. CM27]|uniref:hypothetical protein n=1 Tax=Pseudomonas sp. CM27 TaxID=2738452 RepID=UPI001C499CA5
MVASLGGLTGFLGEPHYSLTCLKPCTKAGNPFLTDMATLQQMWERVHPRSAARAALDLTGAANLAAAPASPDAIPKRAD